VCPAEFFWFGGDCFCSYFRLGQPVEFLVWDEGTISTHSTLLVGYATADGVAEAEHHDRPRMVDGNLGR